MKKLFAVLIVSVLAVQAQAMDSRKAPVIIPTNSSQCLADAKDARKIMAARQAGESYTNMFAVARTEKHREMIADAYTYPVVEKNQRDMESSFFGRKWLKACRNI